MRRALLLTVLVCAPPAHAELVCERWGAADTACSHPGTLSVERGKVVRLRFDLSAVPEGARIRHASLYCSTYQGRQPTEPARIHRAGPDGGPAGAPLALEPPWYWSFDATDAVRAWAKDSKGNRGFVVTRFEGLLPGRSSLEVRYEGKPGRVPEQVTGLRAIHHHGQTFLIWTEHEAFRPPKGSVFYVNKFSRKGNDVTDKPGTGWKGLARVPAITLKTLRHLQGMELRDKPSGFQGIRPAKRVRIVAQVRYRVYRHTERITAANIHEAERVAEVGPLSAYDRKMAVVTFKGEYIDQREVGGSIIPVCCVQDGKPIRAGEAVCVHAPRKGGRSYYAVTCMLAGTENLRDIGGANSLAEPVAETPEPPRPVLQRLQEIRYGHGVLERWYLFWLAPPYANLPGRALHVLVGEPEKLPPPLPMIIDGFHGGFNIVGAMRTPARSALTLLIEHQNGYGVDGDLLYNEGRGTLRSFRRCKVDYFSERYFLRCIDWAMQTWRVDRAKVFGGQHDSGPLLLGVRHPEIFRRIFLGNYTATYDRAWAPGSGALPTILGPRGIARTVDGHDAWDVLSLAWNLERDPGKDVPLVMVSSGTGKARGHTAEFGWQDDPRGMAALRDARQPFLAAWGTNGADPGGAQGVRPVQPGVARMFGRIRWDHSIPAFSNCSLDNNPGNGDPTDGDACGQINGYLIWDNTKGHVDRKDAWQMTVWLVDTCPEDVCAVDVTPRHGQQFRPRPGETFLWALMDLESGRSRQSGTVTADRWGRVTVRHVRIRRSKSSLRIER
jgi:hypothetical protein